MPAITKVCGRCGSEDVKLRRLGRMVGRRISAGSWAYTADHSHCGACDGETTIVDRPIEVRRLTNEDVGLKPASGSAGVQIARALGANIDVVRTVGALGAGGAT